MNCLEAAKAKWSDKTKLKKETMQAGEEKDELVKHEEAVNRDLIESLTQQDAAEQANLDEPAAAAAANKEF